MEKSWENFWTTGKVEDYLSYRSSVRDTEQKREAEYDSKNDVDRQKKEEGTKGTWDNRLL